MDPSTVTLNDLAAKVSDLTRQFSQVLKDGGIPQPTFQPDGPIGYTGLTSESFLLRQQLLDSINDLYLLAQGPSESIINYCHNVMPDQACLSILNNFDFWSAVPLDGSATYDEISQKVNLPVAVVTRVLEHGVTLRLFSRTGSASVQHTSRSAAMVKNPGNRALVTTLLDDADPPMTLMNEALRINVAGKPEIPTDMNVTAFSLLHSGELYGGKRHSSPWDFIENDGEGERKGWRQRNFVDFMRYVKDMFHFDEVVHSSYNWKDAGDIKVVDLGGSGGHDSVVLANKFPNLHITVQDLPGARSEFEKNTPAEIKSRVSFMAHNFFEPQPVEADIYLIKLILHDWPDAECAKIIKSLLPGMKKGSKVVFVDYVGKQTRPDNLPLSIQQMGTSTDLRMLALFNTEERTADTWSKLLGSVDDRLRISRVDSNPLAFYVVIEAVWEG